MQETLVQSLGGEHPLKEEMANDSSTFAWEIPWTEEPGRLQSMVSPRVRDDLATKPHKPRWFLGVPLSLLASSLSSTGLPRMTAPVGTKGLSGPQVFKAGGCEKPVSHLPQ